MLVGFLITICVLLFWIAVCLTQIAGDAKKIEELLEVGRSLPADIAKKTLAHSGYVTQLDSESPLKTPKNPALQLNRIHDSIDELKSAAKETTQEIRDVRKELKLFVDMKSEGT